MKKLVALTFACVLSLGTVVFAETEISVKQMERRTECAKLKDGLERVTFGEDCSEKSGLERGGSERTFLDKEDMGIKKAEKLAELEAMATELGLTLEEYQEQQKAEMEVKKAEMKEARTSMEKPDGLEKPERLEKSSKQKMERVAE